MKRQLNKTSIMWALHNLVAHPVSEVFWWLAFFFELIHFNILADWLEETGNTLHDITIPKHKKGEGRG